MTPLLIWGGAALAYAGFRLWYDGIPRPLEAAEIDELMTRLPATTLADARELANLRTFLAADDGREFVMANLVRLAPEPVPDPDTGKLTRSRDLLERYTADFFPALLRRGGHPVVVGRAIGSYIDSWNVPDDPGWSLLGTMRYRSRRDMMQLVVDPRFARAHQFKIAATPVTFSFPTKPLVGLHLGPRAWVGLALALAAALLHIALV